MKKLLTILAILSLSVGAYAISESETALREQLEALDAKAEAHLQADADNAALLSKDMDEYTEIVHSAPRGSDVRSDAKSSRKKFDCGVEDAEDQRDEIEDRVHSACWCNGCK